MGSITDRRKKHAPGIPGESESGALPLPAAAAATMTRFVLTEDTNSLGIMHGGYMAAFIDEIATVAAFRHAGGTALTKKLEVELLRPARCGNILTLQARIERVGRTSIVVAVEGSIEDPRTRETWPVSRGRVVFVGIDDHGNPAPVPAP